MVEDLKRNWNLEPMCGSTEPCNCYWPGGAGHQCSCCWLPAETDTNTDPVWNGLANFSIEKRGPFILTFKFMNLQSIPNVTKQTKVKLQWGCARTTDSLVTLNFPTNMQWWNQTSILILSDKTMKSYVYSVVVISKFIGNIRSILIPWYTCWKKLIEVPSTKQKHKLGWLNSG
jgi:hypothetical protein